MNAQILTTDHVARKAVPIATGCLDFFPAAIAAIAELSARSTKQHGHDRLYWDRSKSTDEADALMRHFIDRGARDVDGVRHSAKVAWRALALLEKEIEGEQDTDGCDVEVYPGVIVGNINRASNPWWKNAVDLAPADYKFVSMGVAIYPAEGAILPFKSEPGETAQQAADRALTQWQDERRAREAEAAKPVWQRVKVGDRIRIREGAKSYCHAALPTVGKVEHSFRGNSANGDTFVTEIEGDSGPLVSDTDILEILPPYNGLGPDHAHGYTVGETVNLLTSDKGYMPGTVQGFDGSDADILVEWPCAARLGRHRPAELRHGP